LKKEKTISALGVSKKFAMSYQTVNHYTNLGLLVVRKREGNGRFYLESEVNSRLKRISQLKNEGYPLKIIRTMLQ
jgi:DNA-binding transcriptional MerR regulator